MGLKSLALAQQLDAAFVLGRHGANPSGTSDPLVRRPLEALEGRGFELRDVETDFVRETRVLPLVHLGTGINADVVIGGVGIEESFRDRAESADLGGTIVPVAAAEDVVAMKILSGRSKDRDDVIAIISAQGPTLNYDRMRETLGLFEKALDRSDLVAELERARTEATR